MPHKLKKIKTSVPKEKVMVDAMPARNLFPVTFHVDAKQMPEVKDWETGESYRLLIDVNMVSKHEDKREEGASFEISAYEHINKNKKAKRYA